MTAIYAKRPYYAWLLLMPVLVLILFLFVAPIIWNVWVSLHNVAFVTFHKAWPFVGTDNYRSLVGDTTFPKKFHQSIGVTVIFVGFSVIGQFVIGLGLAIALHQKIAGTNLFRAIIVVPWVLSELVVAYLWLFLYQAHGPLNNFLNAIGISSVRWLSDPDISVWSLGIVNIWFGMPFTLLMMGAALTTISPELLDAARVDGASRWRTFICVTLPLIKPFAALNLILITMWTMNIFALPLAMTQGGPVNSTTTSALYMYQQAFQFGNFSIGASIGILLMLFNVAAAMVYLRTQLRDPL